ncbi:TonB-dependent receptor [Bryocella elongata]|uniref:TonB-dependent receptor n=1 Tax=Bryocella elongata TaxID=863522 RepID=UPI00135CA396|nr:TonB-dependent receptor [Bryocella elongata]
MHAQTVTADITGTVTDSAGAVIVGATVTATNEGNGISTTVSTNGAGLYSLRFLQVGSYRVTIDAPRFGKQVVEPVLLEVAQVAKINAILKPGSEETVVDVSAGSAQLLNTENGMISSTISETLINDLPINGHNFQELTQLMPGSTVADGNQWNGAGQSSPNNSGERTQSFATLPNINGNRAYTTNYTLDGISIVDSGANLSNGFGAPTYSIAPEAVQEVTLISNVPPAEYGDGAAQMALVTKSGTNKYHGGLSAYLQNYLMDANLFQNKRVLPGTAFVQRTHYTQSIYNAALGGPVPLLKDKLFFFADMEVYVKPSAGQSTLNVPLNAWRGNTTACSSCGTADSTVSPLAGYAYFGSAVSQLYDSQNGFAPFNQTVGSTTYQNLVPIRNPVAKYLFANSGLLPLPNRTASTAPITSNYLGYTKGLTRNNQGDIRTDWTPTSKDRLSARWSQGEAYDFTSQLIDPISFPTNSDFPFKQLAINYVRTINSNLVNEARIGFTRLHYNQYAETTAASSAFQNGEALVGIPWNNVVAGFSAQSFTQSTNSTGTSTLGTSGSYNLALDNHFTYGDDLTWQHGLHVSKFGVQLYRVQNNLYLNGSGGLLGNFNYNGSFTGNPGGGQSVGYDFADFLLDYSQSYSVTSTNGDYGLRQYRFAAFAQDSFRIRPDLTLNYGVRWEYDQPMYEVHNKMSNISPTSGALLLAGQNGNSRALYNPTYSEFSPRVSFAWNPSYWQQKFVLRGGFGITNYMDYNLIGRNHLLNVPYHLSIAATATTPTATSGGSPFLVTNGFGTSNASATGYSFVSWDKTLKPMFEPQYSLVAEYAITPKSKVTVAYVGNVANHLADQRNINQETLVNTAASAPFNSVTINTGTNTVAIGTSAVIKYESEAVSNFNAGEVTYRLIPTRGLEFQLNYTYSHAMGDTSGIVAINDNNISGGYPQNSYCLSCEYGPNGSDSRHMLSSSWDYALPFGHGKQFATNVPVWLDEVIGGWKVSGSAVLFSGQPNTITATSSAGIGSAGSLRANHYRHMKVVNPKYGLYVTSAGVDASIASPNTFVIAGAWGTDPSATNSGNQGTGTCGQAGHDDGICAYGQPAAGVTGQAPIFGTASVGSERAPGFRQVDASVQKEWKLYHEHILQFLAEAYNVGNIVSYNNQGRTVNGGSTWGYVQSTRSEPRQLELELKYKF